MEVVLVHTDILGVVQDTLAEAIDTKLVLVPLPSEARQNTKAGAHPKGLQNQI